MMHWATAWANAQMVLYRTTPRGFAWRFAVLIALRAVAVAEIGAVCAHLLLNHFGLNAAPLPKALFVATIITVPVASLVAFVIAFSFGRAIEALAVSRDEFERLSATDLLSGLANRRAFFQRVEDMRDGATLALFDIDRFKRINDAHGHLAGDEVIRTVGRVLSETFGQTDAAVGRLGGEEFAVLLRPSPGDGQSALIEQAVAAIAAASVEISPDVTIGVTISAGVADLDAKTTTLETFRLADEALYCAKAAGRNRVVHARDLAEIVAARRNPPRRAAAVVV